MTSLAGFLNPANLRLKASLSEPIYERFTANQDGKLIHVLAFVNSPPKQLATMLESYGATALHEPIAECYNSVWTLSDASLKENELNEALLDMHIEAGLTILHGKYPASSGSWARHLTSQHSDGKPWTSAILSRSVGNAR